MRFRSTNGLQLVRSINQCRRIRQFMDRLSDGLLCGMTQFGRVRQFQKGGHDLVMDIQSILPTNKYDVERARAIVDRGYPTVAPMLSDLLEWMRDYNWPVAQVLAPFLASIGEPLIPYVRTVLDTDDEMWKYWILRSSWRTPPLYLRAFRTKSAASRNQAQRVKTRWR